MTSHDRPVQPEPGWHPRPDPGSARSLRLATGAPLLLLAALAGGLAVGAAPASGQDHGREPPTAEEGVDYVVYDADGRPTNLAAVVLATGDASVLLVGEEHDDMPGHAFEAALFESVADLLSSGAAGASRTVVLSLEMFERDVQYVVDEYLSDLISESHFLASARPWDDYDVRYRPLVEAAKARGLPVVAANAPRRYVNRVSREGPESLAALSEHARSYLPPLPFPGPSDRYRAEWDRLMAEAMRPTPADSEAVEPEPEEPEEIPQEAAPNHQPASNAIYGQALWDAAMGHAITTALVEHLDGLVVHFAGSFHVARRTGIAERIEDYRPGTSVATVVITKTDDVHAWSEEEHAGLADFVVLTRRPAAPDTAGSAGPR